MRKLIAFGLILCLCAGALGYATAAMNDAEDDLVITPLLEVGDISPIAGRTVGLTFSCGQHLRWDTAYTFGTPGTAQTQFTFIQNPRTVTDTGWRNCLDVWFTGGLSAGTSGGDFNPAPTDYGRLLQTVAAITPNGERKSMNVKMSDYVQYYLPDIDLHYETDTLYCDLQMDLTSIITGDYTWTSEYWEYSAFFDHFRFPVREDTIIQVAVEKDSVGNVVGIELSPENGPELHFVSTVNDQGLYFIPIFRDAKGAPLAGEYPDGYGIYFVPWKTTENVMRCQSDGDTWVTKQEVQPDAQNAVNIYPLDEKLEIHQLEISADASSAWMLTREGDAFYFTVLDLKSQSQVNRFAVLDYDPEEAASGGWTHNEDWLLAYTARDVALIDLGGECSLTMTAPVEIMDGRYPPYYLDAEYGVLTFDGENLIMMNTMFSYEGALWVLVCRQGEQVFYGEYDCSILRGNENWYYSSVWTEEAVTFS